MRYLAIIGLLLLIGCHCRNTATDEEDKRPPDSIAVSSGLPAPAPQPDKPIVLQRNVKIRNYFAFLDSLVASQDSLLPYLLTEHLLVRYNPWIIDSLAATDYYRMMERDSFVYDQQQLSILQKGDTLWLPNEARAAKLAGRIKQTRLLANIPEYRLWVLEGEDTLFEFTVRVGRRQSRYLALAGKTVDLRTQPGKGEIIRIARYPLFLDPATGQRFTHTRRDDGRTTLMPLIPWIEPEINGQRYGQLIHPTTNPQTLGKAYSNGCIGLSESDAWYLYYYAPVGTPMEIRYQLERIASGGDTLRFKDIYNWREKIKRGELEKDARNPEKAQHLPDTCICEGR